MQRIMKKLALFIMLICCLLFSSCNTESSQSTTNNSVSPPNNKIYYFTGYEELASAFESTANLTDNSAAVRNEKGQFGKRYEAFVNELVSEGELVPFKDEKPFDLVSKDGISPIVLITNDSLNLPWIWYYCKTDNEEFRIKITYPTVIGDPKLKDDMGASDVLRAIAPEAVNVHNYKEYTGYKSVYEKEIALTAQKNVNALVYELENDSKVSYIIYHNGALLMIEGETGMFTNDFFKSFELKNN